MSASRRLRRLAVVWLPVLALAGIGAVVLPAAHAAPAAQPAKAAPGPDGAALYLQDCATCHGATARGSSRGPSLVGVGEAAVDFQLSTGRMPKKAVGYPAPPYVPILSQADIAALDRYVTALAAHGGPGIPAVTVDPNLIAEGGSLFREYCAACHSVTGVGGELVDRPIPALVGATPTQVGEAVRSGPVQMPAFGPAALDRTQLNAVVSYVSSLRHTDDKGGDPLSHLGPSAEGAVAWMIGLVALLGLARWIGKRG